jgi:DNA-binding SARP family transcriptional activator/tetratricopeptide (TPR) repeat protein
MTRFAVLGPVGVRYQGAELRLPPPKPLALLAMLLMHANEPVSVDLLAQAIWEDGEPPTGRTALQNHILRLRRALGAELGTRLLTRPPGYLIEVHAGELDLDRFTGLRDLGRVAARRGAWADAVRLLGEALAEWSGAPLANVPASTSVLTELQHLTELRLATIELKADAELRVGRPADVVTELTPLTVTHPLRERIREQLMLALYLDGRQGEALTVYADVRATLTAELGVEPGPGLQELHRRILAADLALTAAPPAPTGPLPRQLPAAVPHFTGRARELAELDQARAGCDPSGPAVSCVISGTAGVGKTALAIRWARRIADDFPDGQLYVNMHGFDRAGIPMPATEAARSFLTALAVPAESVPMASDALLGLYRTVLTGRRLLIVLDNARDAEQVRPLLPGSPGCLVIVTSRNQLPGLAADGAYPITLGVLPDRQARDFLTARLGTRQLNRTDAYEQLVKVCAGLPLALSLVAGRAATQPDFPLSALAAELSEASGRLDALDEGYGDQGIRAVLSWSYWSLSEQAARVFRLLGVHPGPDITATAAAAMTETDLAQARTALRELARASMVTEHLPGRFGCHDLLRILAAELARTTDGAAGCRAALIRVLDHYLYAGHRAAMLLNPARQPITLTGSCATAGLEPMADEKAAMAWFHAERDVIVAAIARAGREGLHAHAWQLPWTLVNYLDRQGHWHALAQIERTALSAAIQARDPAAEAISRRSLGAAWIRAGRYRRAQSQTTRALQISRKLRDRLGEAYCHLNLSYILTCRGEHRLAYLSALRAIDCSRAAGNGHAQVFALSAAAVSQTELGHPARAAAYAEQALKLQQATGDRFGQVTTLEGLGNIHLGSGRPERAVTVFRDARAASRELGDRFNEAYLLIKLGDAETAAGNPPAAADAWRLALTILEELHHPRSALVRIRIAANQADHRT